MTNEELKKKIAQIIADYFCPQGNEHKKLWGDDRLCYSKMNFAECEWVTECTDALIAAGMGDVKDVEAEANRYEMLYKLQNRDMALAERRAHDVEHRAEVAEKALKHAVNVYIAHTETSSKKKWWYKYFLREAKKNSRRNRKMETRQLNLFGGEDTISPIKKGNRYLKMQERHGKIEGKTCGTCANCVRYCVGKRSVFKCKSWIITSSAATDIRLKDPACGMYWEKTKHD